MSHAAPLVLIVDDDPCVRDALSVAMGLAGYRVVTAGHGLDALAVVGREPPALVLLDVTMPVLDGPGFIHALGLRGIHLPTVLLTAVENGADLARELGVAAYLRKPCDLELLMETVVRWIGAA